MRNHEENSSYSLERKKGETMMKICPRCSSKISNDAKFCKNCGEQLEDFVGTSSNISVVLSGVLNRTGNLLIKGANKISDNSASEKKEQPIEKHETPTDTVYVDEDIADLEINETYHKVSAQFGVLCRKRKLRVSIVLGIIIILTVFLIFNNSKSAHLIGSWKMYPNSFPGYGIHLDIDKNQIKAYGDSINFGGQMTFRYEVTSGSELVLQYDWTFNQWPWSIPRADKIPLKYSLNEDKTILTLTWDGTSFVFLDNTYNMDIYDKNGAIMSEGSVSFTKVK